MNLSPPHVAEVLLCCCFDVVAGVLRMVRGFEFVVPLLMCSFDAVLLLAGVLSVAVLRD